jgi:hypothetical protein
MMSTLEFFKRSVFLGADYPTRLCQNPVTHRFFADDFEDLQNLWKIN